ncbi:MAG TPA: thiamine phosphate synthase [Gemmatimonadaceae bacterium]|nr:thiamine phosphate synthase [Gemmatimonadaceae bacterium]
MLAPLALTLVAITDGLRGDAAELVSRACAAARGGATMIQLRLKDADARTMVEVARSLIAALPATVPLVVNDRADVAIAAGAAGVHVGPEDVPPSALRRVVPPDFIIGASVGTDAELPLATEADYVGIGPVYATDSKLDAGSAIGTSRLAELITRSRKPAVAIGGIDVSNAATVIDAGAAGVAVIRAIFAAKDPERAARAIRAAMGR